MVAVMAVWDELRVILARLCDEELSPLLRWPDLGDEQGGPPPFRITLAASAVATAAHDRPRHRQPVESSPPWAELRLLSLGERSA